MQGVRFYLDHESPADKRKGKHSGNVTAVFTDTGFTRWEYGNTYSYNYEIAGAVFFEPNSQCAGSAASIDWLRTHAKRISEAKAKTIHPALFAYLNNGNGCLTWNGQH